MGEHMPAITFPYPSPRDFTEEWGSDNGLEEEKSRYYVTIHRDEKHAVVVLRDGGEYHSYPGEWLKSKRIPLRMPWPWYSPWNRVAHHREKFERIAHKMNEQEEKISRTFEGLER